MRERKIKTQFEGRQRCRYEGVTSGCCLCLDHLLVALFHERHKSWELCLAAGRKNTDRRPRLWPEYSVRRSDSRRRLGATDNLETEDPCPHIYTEKRLSTPERDCPRLASHEAPSTRNLNGPDQVAGNADNHVSLGRQYISTYTSRQKRADVQGF